MMEIRFMAPRIDEAGIFASMLKRVYTPLIESYPDTWGLEQVEWEEFDRQVFRNPETIGSCVFLTRSGDELVGFGSYDPRPRSRFGIIGHNCVLPEFQGQGIGSAQVREIIRRFQSMGIRLAQVSTGDHPFFAPARKMYAGCGFQEIRRVPWQREPRQNIIEYKKDLI
jgi:GNAT superfamily N-acetyltransferase